MKKQPDLHFQRDMLKLGCLFGAILGIAAIFVLSPALSTPTMLAVVLAILLSPGVAAVERRGHSRVIAISGILLGLLVLFGIFCAWGVHAGISEWGKFEERVPEYFESSIVKLRNLETALKAQYAFLEAIHPTASLLAWGSRTGQWFVVHGPLIMSQMLGWLFIVPPLTFILLNEGPTFRRRFYQLVPNRYFESFFLISTDIFRGISDYLRAKLLEAILMTILTTLGLLLVNAPYAVVLGILAGVTNIIPYLGPFLGAVPAIIITSFDNPDGHLVFAVAAVFGLINLIDMVVIFPLVVAKLVNLHPLILIAAVGMGQKYYGLVGMLISIPVATALKVILQELYSAVYEYRTMPSPDPLLDEGTHADSERVA